MSWRRTSRSRLRLNQRTVVQCPLLALSGHSATEFQCPLLDLEVKRTSARHCEMSAFDPKRSLYFVLLSGSGAPLIKKGRRFCAAIVAGLQPVKLKAAVFDQLLDWSVEVTPTANTFPSRS